MPLETFNDEVTNFTKPDTFVYHKHRIINSCYIISPRITDVTRTFSIKITTIQQVNGLHFRLACLCAMRI